MLTCRVKHNHMAQKQTKTVAIFGVNGFIGHHLLRRILDTTDWKVIGFDISETRIASDRHNKRFTFYKGDLTKDIKTIEKIVKAADTVLPLAGIATPQTYMVDPLKVFEVDFEANLPIVRLCAKYDKYLIWPSTSEVYGMSPDNIFNPETSPLVVGPIHRSRWIYSTAKQMMDRVIWAYGTHRKLRFTIFRPFNWTGIGLDDIDRKGKGSARVITQFLGNVLRGENLILVDAGMARRSFTYVDDCIDALMKIIENKNGIAYGKIYNIGNPYNNHSIKELADQIVQKAPNYRYFKDKIKKVQIVSKTAKQHYGEGYEDVNNRVPFIENTVADLDWTPKVDFPTMIDKTFMAYVELFDAAKKVPKKKGAYARK